MHRPKSPQGTAPGLEGAIIGLPPHLANHAEDIYNEFKCLNLNITTVAELKKVPWEKLLAAYQVCVLMHALGEQAMIDGEFLSEDWADTFSFGGEGNGELIIGNTGAKGAVVDVMTIAGPTAEPKPSCEAFITTLSSVLPPSKASSILDAYKISPLHFWE
jgi:hypothetical protein